MVILNCINTNGMELCRCMHKCLCLQCTWQYTTEIFKQWWSFNMSSCSLKWAPKILTHLSKSNRWVASFFWFVAFMFCFFFFSEGFLQKLMTRSDSRRHLSIQETKNTVGAYLPLSFFWGGLHPPGKLRSIAHLRKKQLTFPNQQNGKCELLVCLFVPVQHVVVFFCCIISAEWAVKKKLYGISTGILKHMAQAPCIGSMSSSPKNNLHVKWLWGIWFYLHMYIYIELISALI